MIGPRLPRDGLLLWREVVTDDDAYEIPILVIYEYSPASGDGWNEPRERESAYLYPPDGVELSAREIEHLMEEAIEREHERAFDRFYGN